MILTKAETSSAPLLWTVDSFNLDSMGANSAPPAVARFNMPEDGEGE